MIETTHPVEFIPLNEPDKKKLMDWLAQPEAMLFHDQLVNKTIQTTLQSGYTLVDDSYQGINPEQSDGPRLVEEAVKFRELAEIVERMMKKDSEPQWEFMQMKVSA